MARYDGSLITRISRGLLEEWKGEGVLLMIITLKQGTVSLDPIMLLILNAHHNMSISFDRNLCEPVR